MEVYSSEQAALDSISCGIRSDTMKPPALTTVEETDFEEVRDFIAKDARRKREEEMQGDEYRGNFIDPNILPQPTTQRGDIPSNAIESCDGNETFNFNKLFNFKYSFWRAIRAEPFFL